MNTYPAASVALSRLSNRNIRLGNLEGGMHQGSGPNPLLPLGISTGDVWHYTAAGGLHGILRSDSLWGSYRIRTSEYAKRLLDTRGQGQLLRIGFEDQF